MKEAKCPDCGEMHPVTMIPGYDINLEFGDFALRIGEMLEEYGEGLMAWKVTRVEMLIVDPDSDRAFLIDHRGVMQVMVQGRIPVDEATAQMAADIDAYNGGADG